MNAGSSLSVESFGELMQDAVDRESQLARIADQEDARRIAWTPQGVMRADIELIRRLWTALRDASKVIAEQDRELARLQSVVDECQRPKS